MAREWVISEEDLGCDGSYLSYNEVVRCGDCRYRTTVNQPYDIEFCLNLRENIKSLEWYCADGEGREEDE